MTLDLDLDALEALEKKATQGKWMVYDSNSWRRIGIDGEYREILWPDKARDGHPEMSGINRDNDLVVLTAARNSLPELIRLARIGQRVERMEKELNRASVPLPDFDSLGGK